MEYEKFVKQIGKLNIEQRTLFCKKVLTKETRYSKTALAATFQLGASYYYKGDFKQAKDIIEPIMMMYQKYEHIKEVNSGFNLLGAVAHYYREYELARYYYSLALKIAQENQEVLFYSYEYNNIALSYIEQEKYKKALEYILLAKENLKEEDPDMGAYVYANMSLIYHGLNQIDEALKAYEKGIKEYRGNEIIPHEYLAYGILIYYSSQNKRKYEEFKQKGLSKLNTMPDKNCIDVCKSLFYCACKSKDDILANRVLSYMDLYVKKHAEDVKAKLMAEDFRYSYAETQKDVYGMLQALKKQKEYQNRINEENQFRRTKETNRYYTVNQQLQEALEKADKANKVKTQFLSNMSHDMRTPINGIMGMLSMIDKYRNDEAKVNDCLSKIDASSKHLLSLVNDVLDMNKLDSDVKMTENESFNLDVVCHQVDEIVRPQAEQEGIQVYQAHVDVSDVYLIGNAMALQKILINLFSNSIKYNKPNGSIYTSLMELNRTQSTITYEFKIRDTGIGMDQEFIENNLYEPFVQGGNAARSKYAGTGLGMSIVKGLIKKLHGNIEVESEVDVGTCFTVILTFDLDLNHKKETKKRLVNTKFTGKKILLVEDNELNMEVAQFLLEDLDAKLVTATNGKEAIQVFLNENIDLILMDLMMPVMNGYEATLKLRELDPNIPIIAMSANAYNEDVKKCLDAGMNAHISKPLDKNVLIQTISKYI